MSMGEDRDMRLIAWIVLTWAAACSSSTRSADAGHAAMVDAAPPDGGSAAKHDGGDAAADHDGGNATADHDGGDAAANRGAGDGVLPAWVPAPGSFADISLNSMADVDPCPGGGCAYSEVTGQESVFSVWSGGAFAPDFSSYGALLCHGGGHAGYSGNEVYAFDLSTRLWERLGTPSPYAESDADDNGEYPDGKPFPPHTYQSQAFLSSANGGGAKGSFLRFGFAGASVKQWAHRFDLATSTWSRFADLSSIPTNQSYFGACFDPSRNVYWILGGGDSSGGIGKLSAGGTLAIVGKGDNVDGQHVLGYCPPHDMLVNFGTASGKPHIAGWLCTASATTYFAPLKVTGDGPGTGYNGGLEWSTLLGCFVTYPGNGSKTVYKLTPPAKNPLVDSWVWSSETLTGANGAAPITANYPSGYNGHWSRFREAPLLKSFVYADGRRNPVQLWRLTGM
jgi:hypothetical protein